MIEILKAVLFGVVEGITEWLPISSTGHLILLNEVVSFDLPGTAEEQAAFMEFYDVVIQLGAILAIIILFFKEIWPFGLQKKDEIKIKVGDLEDHYWFIAGDLVIKRDIFFMWLKIAVACVPGLVYGLLLDDWVESVTADFKPLIVGIMLVIVGIVFIIVEIVKGHEKPMIRNISEITFMSAFIIGLCQLIAGILPGTSRSGACIIGALLLGMSRTVAAEYTFYLAIPTMFGASLLKLVKYLGKGLDFDGMQIAIVLVSSAVAFGVSMLAVKFLMGYVKRHDFKPFGIYRIILGIAVIVVFALGFR
ncbi:MAG: undecaprenyl-diphosphate phosphatase [Lachnospiraceae bacterium]|nr:undecaprenyl-diphosphate phosphatase [Lachnospiraceae bacterium]